MLTILFVSIFVLCAIVLISTWFSSSTDSFEWMMMAYPIGVLGLVCLLVSLMRLGIL
jgi:hypothetical protein